MIYLKETLVKPGRYVNNKRSYPTVLFHFPLDHDIPISIVRKEIIDIFMRIGFIVSEGPEIEDDDHVFTRLNFAPEHPARDMQDTFYISRKSEGRFQPGRYFTQDSHFFRTGKGNAEGKTAYQKLFLPEGFSVTKLFPQRHNCHLSTRWKDYILMKCIFCRLKQTLLFSQERCFGKETKIN